MKVSSNALEKAKKIKLIIMDVDGTLTDGKIHIGENGELFKSFNCRDGFGINVANKIGMKTAILTGRNSICTTNRAKELGISSVKQGHMDKRDAYKELKSEFNLNDEEIAYIGDDIIDLPVFVQVGLKIAVGDADFELQERADIITEKIGGNGAVRDAIEFILKSQGKWEKIIEEYTTIER